jgi:hypothetical protein
MLCLIILIVASVLCWVKFKSEGGAGVFNAFSIVFILSLIPMISYFGHAEDLGTIRAQKHVIHAYEQRVGELNDQLKTMVPEGKQLTPILLNADSPIRSITASISKANEDLAKARVVEANARVSIQKRKAGPFYFIVTWFGED